MKLYINKPLSNGSSPPDAHVTPPPGWKGDDVRGINDMSRRILPVDETPVPVDDNPAR